MNRLRGAIAGLLGVVYLWGLAPSVHVHDAGELTSAAWTLGVGHPPGAPLYMILSKLFLLLVPFGSIAWRANFFSAVVAVGAFLVFDAVARRVTEKSGLSLACASAFGLSAAFWSQAVMAEVYTLAALLLLMFLWFATIAVEGNGGQRRAALCWGLLLACHVGLALVTPAVLFLIASRAGLGIRARLRAAMGLLPPALSPLLLYAYVPLRSLADPAVDWGNPESLQSWWWHLSNRAVRGRMLSLSPFEYMERAGDFLRILGENLHLLLPFALVGLAAGFKRNRPLVLLLALLASADGAFAVLMDTAPLASEAYAIPCTAALTMLAAWGLSTFEGPVLEKGAVVVAICATTVSFGLNKDPNDLHRNFLARDAAEGLLAQTPSGATLLVQEDSTTNALAYLCLVEGARRDLEIFDRLSNLFGSLYDRPPFTVAAADRAAYRRSREEPALRSRIAGGKPVFFSTPHLDYAAEGFQLAPGEYATRACLPGTPCPPPGESAFPPPRAGDHPDWMSRQLLAELATRRAEAALSRSQREAASAAVTAALAAADLPELFLLSGQQARRAGDPQLALRATQECLARRPGFAPALYLKGSLLIETGEESEGRAALLAASAADPSLPQPHSLLGALAARRGDWASARESFNRSLEIEPRQPELLLDRARVSAALGDLSAAEADLRAALRLRPEDRGCRVRLVKLLAQSQHTREAAEELCAGCDIGPAEGWSAPVLKEFLLVAAQVGFPPCVGEWLRSAHFQDSERDHLRAGYLFAQGRVQQR